MKHNLLGDPMMTKLIPFLIEWHAQSPNTHRWEISSDVFGIRLALSDGIFRIEHFVTEQEVISAKFDILLTEGQRLVQRLADAWRMSKEVTGGET
jgi:hypothetical protein